MFTHNVLEDVVLSHGDNASLYDDKGKMYIDFTAGIFAANIGHSNPAVTEAISQQAEKLIHSYTFQTKIREEYLDKLCKFTGFEAAALFSAGTEATEAAWKVARQYKGVMGVWGMPEAFHGKTLGALIMASKFGSPHFAQPYDKTCMMILEPYVAWKGTFHDEKTMDRIRGYKNDKRFLVCCDEIQAGFGRTGKLFGYQHYNHFQPDLVTIGKGMANGFPLSALLGSKKIISEPVMDLSSTHGGNPLACAVGSACIDFIVDNDIINEAERKGKIMHKAFKNFPVITHGKGLMAALWFESTAQANKVVLECAKKGLLVIHTGRSTVKLGPPLTIPDLQLTQGLEILKEVCKEVMGDG